MRSISAVARVVALLGIAEIQLFHPTDIPIELPTIKRTVPDFLQVLEVTVAGMFVDIRGVGV